MSVEETILYENVLSKEFTLFPRKNLAPIFSNRSSTYGTCEKPRHILDIDNDIRSMDSTYGVNFHTWVKSNSNTKHISKFLQRFFAEYDSECLALGISWIIAGWNLRSTAELLLHSFYIYGIGHVKVARVIDCIAKNFDSEFSKLELFAAIVAQEPAENSARFFRHLTRSWPDHGLVCNAVIYTVKKLSWSERYFREFLRLFCTFTENDFNQEVYKVARERRMNFVEEMLKHYDESKSKSKSKLDTDIAETDMSELGIAATSTHRTKLKYFMYIFEEFVRGTQSTVVRCQV